VNMQFDMSDFTNPITTQHSVISLNMYNLNSLNMTLFQVALALSHNCYASISKVIKCACLALLPQRCTVPDMTTALTT